ncbi:unnamed protein product [Phytophthora fragariaefolia]|uniref:Unnamed protein product n=1 Tax=Phytophthora fragariaefolia TaxID=1490495 RepID=A0A9W6UB75_9STRA|nr:unnamed protein product [Phytophthora fragariaefolia]
MASSAWLSVPDWYWKAGLAACPRLKDLHALQYDGHGGGAANPLPALELIELSAPEVLADDASNVNTSAACGDSPANGHFNLELIAAISRWSSQAGLCDETCCRGEIADSITSALKPRLSASVHRSIVM